MKSKSKFVATSISPTYKKIARISYASLLAVGLTVAATQPASAAVTITSTNGDLAASARFDAVAGNLRVVVTNTSVADAVAPTDILTALFFDLTADPDMSAFFALICDSPGAMLDCTAADSCTPPVAGEFGITSAGDNPAAGNCGLNNNALIQNQVTFLPGSLAVGFNVDTGVSSDVFQYGTAMAVPEPESYLMILAGLGLMGFVARRCPSTGDIS